MGAWLMLSLSAQNLRDTFGGVTILTWIYLD